VRPCIASNSAQYLLLSCSPREDRAKRELLSYAADEYLEGKAFLSKLSK
jgi:hypothetical protein